MALTDNLVAYYKLDESSGNAADSSGNGYTLTNTNTVGYGAAKINNGADFGSSNTNKVLTIANNVGITGGNITISMWVKMNAEISSSTQVFIHQESATNNIAYSIRYSYNAGTRRLEFYRSRLTVADNGKTYNVTLGTSNWYHLVLTYNGTNVEGYVNGSSIGTGASSGSGGNAGGDLVNIGLWSGTTFPCQSIIDEVGVWSRALSTDEITALYNSGNGLQYPFTTTNIKSINSLAKSSCKSYNGLAMSSIKSINGLS